MNDASRLSTDLFLSVVTHAPLVSIDLVCRNERDEVLLGMRRNRPAQDRWFVPGGRILKGERVDAALCRIVEAELGLAGGGPAPEFLGVFEHLYEDNFAGVDGIGTHYVVLAYQLRLDTGAGLAADAQHSELRWFPIGELLASPQVHEHTRAYFDARLRMTRVP
ncbi:GDP-mannose mannosyl hydrolase [Caldimonas tepidiphila]|uniref:GDP-mannose mannosyl hydrolase n=1 Tax=Caldimonas tepidiphila TaxID=2315841 RepID=UPI000E5BB19F|nr:GDP-mannose mannosyl hydrolase [Caldimonas tepidiphila]